MTRRAFPSLLILLALCSPAVGIFGCGGSAGHEAITDLDAEPAAGDESFEDVSCPAPALCIAVGNEQQNGKGLAKEWSGEGWKSIGDADALLKAISCPTSTWCMAVGNNPSGAWSLERDGARGSSDWEIQPLSLPHAKSWSELLLNDVSCTGRTACTAAGNYSDGSYKNYAARWDGKSWKRERPPNPKDKDEIAAPTHGMLGVSCPSADFCVTVGAFKWLPLVEHWDGSEWKIVSAPHPEGSPSAYLESVFCTSPNACMAVGNVTVGKTTGPFAERWDGSRWSVVKTPHGDANGTGNLRSVFCSSQSSCIAVGGLSTTGQTGLSLAMTWSGSRWTRRPSPNPKPYTQLAGVSCPSRGLCMAVGQAGADWGTGTLLAAELTKPWTPPPPAP